MSTWSPQQEQAIKTVRSWIRDRNAPQVFRLFGFAGTGKTTIAKDIASFAHGQVLFGAFTGKAAQVLRSKGCDGARTIHSLIYVPEDEGAEEPRFVLNQGSEVRDASLVIIDECSMVGEELGRDLLSFGTKVLVLGDPAQLPPVSGAGFFTEGVEPNSMLTEVHRQARDNPIIAMSMQIREGGSLSIGSYGESRVITRNDITSADTMAADQILVGLNRTRVSYNRRMRELHGRMSATPVKGDRLVCLRNDRGKKLFNGSLWTVARKPRVRGEIISLHVSPEDADEQTKPTAVKVRREFFDGDEADLDWKVKRGTQEFTYGYALTVHKSQGSQWNDVIVFDESGAFRDSSRRWLYTAVTRAANRVTIVQSRQT